MFTKDSWYLNSPVLNNSVHFNAEYLTNYAAIYSLENIRDINR